MKINNNPPSSFGLAQVLAVGPLDALTAKKLASEAFSVAYSVGAGLPGGHSGAHNGAEDAFRHCYWSCRMTQEIGADQASTVGTVHEDCGGGPAAETAMDMFNNAIGISVGMAAGSTLASDCRDGCLYEVLSGGAQTSL
jgi:hypothetical protein